MSRLAGVRVLLVEHEERGHVPDFVRLVAKAARSQGAHVELFAPTGLVDAMIADGVVDDAERYDVGRAGGPARREARRAAFVRAAVVHARTRRADVVHWLDLDGFVVALAAAPVAAPVEVAELHRAYFAVDVARGGARALRAAFVRMAFRRLARRAAVVVHDDAVARALADVAPTVVVRMPVDVSGWPVGAARERARARARAAWGVQDDAHVALAFGALRRDKGLPTVIAAMGHLPEQTRLVVAGVPVHHGADAVRAWARDAGVRERVLVHPTWLPPDAVAAAFAAADAIALPYRPGFAGASGPLALGGAYGVPVVVSDLPELADVVRAYGVGHVARPGGPSAFAHALRAAFDSGPPSVAATAAFRAAHDLDAYRERLVELYGTSAADAPSRAAAVTVAADHRSTFEALT